MAKFATVVASRHHQDAPGRPADDDPSWLPRGAARPTGGGLAKSTTTTTTNIDKVAGPAGEASEEVLPARRSASLLHVIGGAIANGSRKRSSASPARRSLGAAHCCRSAAAALGLARHMTSGARAPRKLGRQCCVKMSSSAGHSRDATPPRPPARPRGRAVSLKLINFGVRYGGRRPAPPSSPLCRARAIPAARSTPARAHRRDSPRRDGHFIVAAGRRDAVSRLAGWLAGG
jgi:hypothetical protein